MEPRGCNYLEKVEGRAAWWWNDAFGAPRVAQRRVLSTVGGSVRPVRQRKWSILICSYPSCQRHQPDQADANRGVAVCLPRARYRSLVTAQTSYGDATDVWTRPIPSHPSPDQWEWSGAWKCPANGSRRTEMLQSEPKTIWWFLLWSKATAPVYFALNVMLNLPFSFPHYPCLRCDCVSSYMHRSLWVFHPIYWNNARPRRSYRRNFSA